MPVRCAEKQAPAQYIRYTPSQQGVSFNSGATQRVIRMVEQPKDPMEPPKFKWVVVVVAVVDFEAVNVLRVLLMIFFFYSLDVFICV